MFWNLISSHFPMCIIATGPEKARKSKTFFHAFDTINHTISKIAAFLLPKSASSGATE